MKLFLRWKPLEILLPLVEIIFSLSYSSYFIVARRKQTGDWNTHEVIFILLFTDHTLHYIHCKLWKKCSLPSLSRSLLFWPLFYYFFIRLWSRTESYSWCSWERQRNWSFWVRSLQPQDQREVRSEIGKWTGEHGRSAFVIYLHISGSF